VGEFKRVEDLHFYDDTGNNFSASYNFSTPEFFAACTVYVYPLITDDSSNRPSGAKEDEELILRNHYNELKSGLVSMYRARLFWDASYELPRHSFTAKGKKAIFEFEGQDGQVALSHLYLFIYKDRFVKYRFTYPSEYNDIARPEIEKFLMLFQWP